MLYKVEVRNAQGALLSLPLDDVSSGLVVQDIQGLDPVKATIVSSNFAQLDGTQYHSSRREARNIIMVLGLEPDYVMASVRDLRNSLYSFFMPKSEIFLRFYMDEGLTVNIMGRVETFEAPLFAKEPKAFISILCFDPDFLDLDPVELTGSSTSTTDETTITYDGSVETGLVFVLNVNRTLGAFTFYFKPPDGTLRSMDFAASLVTGDVLTINTVSGAKGATLTRAGTNSSLLYAVSPQSNWHELQNGDNKIRIYATGAAVPYTLTYTARYGGL